MANNFANPVRKDLPMEGLTKVPTIANKDDGRNDTTEKQVPGMSTKPLLPMASSDVPAVAKAVPNNEGGEKGLWGKATSEVPAVATSFAKSGKGKV